MRNPLAILWQRAFGENSTSDRTEPSTEEVLASIRRIISEDPEGPRESGATTTAEKPTASKARPQQGQQFREHVIRDGGGIPDRTL